MSLIHENNFHSLTMTYSRIEQNKMFGQSTLLNVDTTLKFYAGDSSPFLVPTDSWLYIGYCNEKKTTFSPTFKVEENKVV